MTAKIIIVTGTPGVGKTTLARLLARETRFELLNLSKFVKDKKLYSEFDRSSRAYVLEERKVRKGLQDYFKLHQKNGLILEVHSLGAFFPTRSVAVAVVIRLDPKALARRLSARRWPKKKIWVNVEAEIIDLALHDALSTLGRASVYEIDSTRKRPQELLKEAIQLISAGKGWDGRTPNWLARYDPIELSRRIL